MNQLKSNVQLLLYVLVIGLSVSCKNNQKENIELNTVVLTAANSWVLENPEMTESLITEKGIQNWNEAVKIRTYFKVMHTGKLHLGIRGKARDGASELKVTFNGASESLTIRNNEIEDYVVGTFEIAEPGYVFVEIEGMEKSGAYFADIEAVLIGGEVANSDLFYVKDDVYWGRRGPSVHLSYKAPEEASEILYFYNEMTISSGEDVVGSYFMANGFAEGYFGIQVNSEVERRILFSIWSPFKTDDPNAIPDDEKIILLSKGEDVITGEFGNEGSGGQSRKVFNWQADTTYQFLMKVEPNENNSTDYTAYFLAPEKGEWELIASFRRPKTTTYLKRPHSFLENFIPSMGAVSRKVNYSNQWIYDTNGTWFEMTQAKFTADATARKDARLDYAGGNIAENFYLMNCGFFSETTVIDSEFTRTAKGITPKIDFRSLPE